MRISVVIPAYNAAAFIGETIRSAQSQTHAPLEIIVVDDGSIDATARIAREFGCCVIRQPNGGVCAARNAGILAATGDWIALLDHDDIWEPAKLERIVDAATLCQGVSCFASDFVRQRDGTPPGESCLSEPKYGFDSLSIVPVTDTILHCTRAGEEILSTGWFLFPSSMVIRRDLLLSVGMFRTEQRLCEDVDCFLRVLRHTSLVVVREALWRWREHAANNSRNVVGIAEGWLRLGQYVSDAPDAFPPRTQQELEPILRAVRRSLVAEYTAQGDFRNARRISRTGFGGRLTPSDAALAVVVEFPPPLWAMLRRARSVFRSFSFTS